MSQNKLSLNNQQTKKLFFRDRHFHRTFFKLTNLVDLWSYLTETFVKTPSISICIYWLKKELVRKINPYCKSSKMP